MRNDRSDPTPTLLRLSCFSIATSWHATVGARNSAARSACPCVAAILASAIRCLGASAVLACRDGLGWVMGPLFRSRPQRQTQEAERSPQEAALWGGGLQRAHSATRYQRDRDIRFEPQSAPRTSFRRLWTLTGPHLDLNNTDHGLMQSPGRPGTWLRLKRGQRHTSSDFFHPRGVFN